MRCVLACAFVVVNNCLYCCCCCCCHRCCCCHPHNRMSSRATSGSGCTAQATYGRCVYCFVYRCTPLCVCVYVCLGMHAHTMLLHVWLLMLLNPSPNLLTLSSAIRRRDLTHSIIHTLSLSLSYRCMTCPSLRVMSMACRGAAHLPSGTQHHQHCEGVEGQQWK